MVRKLMVDSSICTGCQYCEIICSLHHSKAGEVNPKKARIKIVSDILHGKDKPVVCRQCQQPVCLAACKFKAIYIDTKLGIALVDTARCTGCGTCVESCPFGAMFFDPVENVALKCDLCGGEPQCVRFCRTFPHTGYPALAYVEPRQWATRKQGTVRPGEPYHDTD
ncbi:Thiosulfate reductase electron transfer subunit PhsB [Neomoorella glycerini]|uniref:Thiosulfate reductase electron transfer subunit PhsB n=1 Tax=Neomoorella glycerini TaxID=55779 RepID=A0A6I5ZTX7_9FIRM|nr:4Fe-4S dicluster domain-containing protein [Moorella glycerini]QGP93138.1 Thiosulfate reductase electron transfer subunit PhsB [Moorella glycerini]